MKKQDTVDEGDGIEDTFGAGAGGGGSEHAGDTHQYPRSFSPSNLQLPADFISTQRLDRESSLEAIPQQSGSVILHIIILSACMYMYISIVTDILICSTC